MRYPRRASITLTIGFAAGFSILAAIYLVPRLRGREAPEEIARAYYLDTYTRDFSAAWEMLSTTDQHALTREDFLAENPPPSELQSALLQELARLGSFEAIAITSTDPSRAVVSAHVRFPDQEQIEIEELLATGVEAGIDLDGLTKQLRLLSDSNQLRFIDEVVNIELISEGNRWRVDQKLGHTINIQLEAAVSDNLPWDFYPLKTEVSAMPGELITVTYLARNNSETAITGKAVHEVFPVEATRFFETIECFCFTEQVLAPGEEREMVLLFTIDPLLPRDTTGLRNLYTFYTLESFPPEG